MLDNTEPTDDSSTDQAAAPVTKAPRKAPAKRAPRKAPATKVAAGGFLTDSAAASDSAVVTESAADAQSAAPPAPVEPAHAEQPDAAQAPKKAARVRKAPAKKAAARIDEAATTAGSDSAAHPTAQAPAEPAAIETAANQSVTSEPVAAPVKRTPRKRVSKAAAAQQAADSVTHASAAEAPAAEAPPALAAPAVLFQPPAELPAEAKAPSRRRRAAKQPPVQPDLVAEDEQTEELELPETAPDSSDVDADLQPEADPDEAEAGEPGDGSRRRRRRGRRGRGSRSGDGVTDTETETESPAVELDEDGEQDETVDHAEEVAEAALSASARRRRRRRRSSGPDGAEPGVSEDDPPNTVVHVRDGRAATESRSNGGGRDNRGGAADEDGVRGVKGSTRLEAKRQRRRDNRDTGRRRAPILTEAEFLARRESVDRVMAVRQTGDRTQIAVLEDGILVEHYVTRASASSAVGNVYLGRVQNVLPSMEAAFVDIGRGRNGVLYAGEVNWDVAGLEGKARSIENALNPGDMVLVQVTKDPIGHKGARLTSQVSLPGRFVVYVPGGGMTGISRKLPDVERSRLKAILKKVVPDEAGVIVRTAAEGASEQDLISDVERLKTEWESISAKSSKSSDGPALLHGEPDLAIRVVRDIFNDDFKTLVVAGSEIHRTISDYVRDIAPEFADRISLHTGESDLFRDLRVDEQLAKALDRKVWLPSGGSLVIDRTEAMTVVDVNTGKYTGSGGNLEQTVTRNNLEAAEEIVRQLRLRDIGGIVVIDFIDMVLESNRDLVLRRLTECLGRDRTKHQVAEVTSLGLVQMTRKRVGEGLLEAFSEPCATCNGRGVIVHLEPVDKKSNGGNGSNGAADPQAAAEERPSRGRRTRKAKVEQPVSAQPDQAALAAEADKRRAAANAVAAIAAATNHHDESADRAQQALVVGAQPASDGAVPAQEGTRRGAARGTARKAAQEPAAQEAAAQQPAPEFSDEQAGASAPPRPRRRRAASRPAGPPVPVSVTEG